MTYPRKHLGGRSDNRGKKQRLAWLMQCLGSGHLPPHPLTAVPLLIPKSPFQRWALAFFNIPIR